MKETPEKEKSTMNEATVGATRSDWEQPLIAVDLVPLSLDPENGLMVHLAEREFPPFEGEKSLPGVLMGGGETVEEAARRAMRSKMGMDLPSVPVVSAGVSSETNRDPRTRSISLVNVVPVSQEVVKTFGEGISAVAVDGIGVLPFDHQKLISMAEKELMRRVTSLDPEVLIPLIGGHPLEEDKDHPLGVTAPEVSRMLTLCGEDGDNMTRRLNKSPKWKRTESIYSKTGGRPSPLWVANI